VQQPHNDNFRNAPIGRHPCPICGEPMFMVTIEPTEKRGYDQRTFECSPCAYGETTVVELD